MICLPLTHLNVHVQIHNLAQKAARCPMDSAVRRLENRSPVHVTVDLSSLDVHTVAQQGVTENVSARGARVVTNKPWQPNDHVKVRSLLGSLRSRARVVYCQPMGKDSFAIGLELFVSVGEWTLPQTMQRHQG